MSRSNCNYHIVPGPFHPRPRVLDSLAGDLGVGSYFPLSNHKNPSGKIAESCGQGIRHRPGWRSSFCSSQVTLTVPYGHGLIQIHQVLQVPQAQWPLCNGLLIFLSQAACHSWYSTRVGPRSLGPVDFSIPKCLLFYCFVVNFPYSPLMDPSRVLS